MIYNTKYRALFTAIPKTGTRSVYNVLKTQYEFIQFAEHFVGCPVFINQNDYYKFTTIRNPYDRVVSMWWSTCKRERGIRPQVGSYFRDISGSDKLEDLLRWMLKIKNKRKTQRSSQMLSLQSDYLNAIQYDNILRFENLNEDFNTLPFLKEKIKLPKLNVTTHAWKENKNPRNSDYTEYLTPNIINMINEYYKEDFDLLTTYERL